MSHATHSESASTLDSSSQATTNRSDKVAMYWTIGLWIGLAAVSVLAIAGIYFQSTQDDSSTAATPPAVTTTTVQPVAAKSVQPPVAVQTVLEPIELMQATEPEAPLPDAAPIAEESVPELASVDALEKEFDDHYSPGRAWSNHKCNQTPCWTSESPFGVWGSMAARSSDDFATERPSD